MSAARGFALLALAASACLAACARDPMDAPGYAEACHGPPVRTPEDRQAAAEAGYEINNRFDCIDRKSFEGMQALQAYLDKERAAQDSARHIAPIVEKLWDARRGFTTTVTAPASGMPVPTPPADLFVRSDYKGGEGRELVAFVTPDPRDGAKHAAILWLTGGDSNSLDDFWTEGQPANDQSASAFRKAGMILMFPTLRGGNTDSGRKEFFFGEVDDVHAAANHLARLPYVDAARIYLGGHSTGGTLALLVAETGGRFAAVFAFGPVTAVNRYPAPLVPDALSNADARELRLRSPIHWVAGISTPTYLIEGDSSPGNADDLEELCAPRNPLVHCIPAAGFDHFSVLWPLSRTIAARLVTGVPDGEPVIRAQQFARGATNGE
ncbi:MAG: prolyl oligopeptidase family serine peptidase [Steroidobacteraceae bacterium]|nr:prolyl oligopeptidase family serine peptidase [Steroidobacteraceae bacterium]